MEILNKNDKALCHEYETFVNTHINGNFLQSLKWTKVKTEWGWEAVISRDESGKIVGACLVLIKKIPFTGFTLLYASHGPVCDWRDKAVMDDLLEGVKVLAKKHRSYGFIWDPCCEEKDTDIIELIKGMGFSFKEKAPDYTTIQMRHNYMIRDLQGKTEEEVMMSFKPDWRNRVRKASRKGVVCKVHGKEALDVFYPIAVETGKRDDFIIRPKEYYGKILDAFPEDQCRLYICYVNNEETGGKDVAVSGAITIQYAGKTCYLVGASSNQYRNTMPNYLMQWTMIQWALENNCFIYDFMGIPNFWDKEHPDYGMYKFKKGFGGEAVSYAGEFFYCFSKPKKALVDFMQKVYDGIRGVIWSIRK